MMFTKEAGFSFMASVLVSTVIKTDCHSYHIQFHCHFIYFDHVTIHTVFKSYIRRLFILFLFICLLNYSATVLSFYAIVNDS